MKTGLRKGTSVEEPTEVMKLLEQSKNFAEVKHLILPERNAGLQELKDEASYFKQQLFNEVRRCSMHDYLSSKEHFLDFGE